MPRYLFRVGRLALDTTGPMTEAEAKARAMQTFEGLPAGEWIACGEREFFWQEAGPLCMDIIEPDYHDDRWAAWADAEERRALS